MIWNRNNEIEIWNNISLKRDLIIDSETIIAIAEDYLNNSNPIEELSKEIGANSYFNINKLDINDVIKDNTLRINNRVENSIRNISNGMNLLDENMSGFSIKLHILILWQNTI